MIKKAAFLTILSFAFLASTVLPHDRAHTLESQHVNNLTECETSFCEELLQALGHQGYTQEDIQELFDNTYLELKGNEKGDNCALLYVVGIFTGLLGPPLLLLGTIACCILNGEKLKDCWDATTDRIVQRFKAQ